MIELEAVFKKFKKVTMYEPMCQQSQAQSNNEIKVWNRKIECYMKDASDLEKKLNELLDNTQHFMKNLHESTDFKYDDAAEKLQLLEKQPN